MSERILLTGAGLLAVGGLLVLLSGRADLRRRWAVWVGAPAAVSTAAHLPHGMTVLAVVLATVAGVEYARLTDLPARPTALVLPVATLALSLLPLAVVAASVAVAPLVFAATVGRRLPAAALLGGVALFAAPLAALAAAPPAWTVPALVAVSVADVAAWVGGRTLGRRGWWAGGISRWSPNKTRGGALFALVAGGALLVCFGTGWLAALVPLCGLLGDLRESRLKRVAGVKDAGTWLPGFGGLLDRIDSVLGAMVGIGLSLVVAGHPAVAVLGLVAVVVTRHLAAPLRRVGWRTAFAATGGLTVRGALPRGGCVVVAEHASHADTPALLAALDAGHRPTVAAAADYWFDSAWRRILCRTLVAGFPVHRRGGGMADLRAVGPQLAAGRAVVVFPAGTRAGVAPNGATQPVETGNWHLGAFRLAAEYGVPVVPVAVVGTGRLLPKSGRLTRHHVTVTVGWPLTVEDPVTTMRAARHVVGVLTGCAGPGRAAARMTPWPAASTPTASARGAGWWREARSPARG